MDGESYALMRLEDSRPIITTQQSTLENDSDKSQGQVKYFVPPGLRKTVDLFEAHFKTSKEDPILIIGPTGVGKSFFSHIFEKLYREKYKDQTRNPIIKVNCSHFGGDTNMIRSELFGHLKGSFTGAYQERDGLVEYGKTGGDLGGAIILEEIGDLPKETQAMLLTFIETGEYFKVGEEYSELRKPRKAKKQIVGTTNREETLRDDLKFRFRPFYLPPIHGRRQDILYYLYAKYPEVIDWITPHEVLSLLSYNWPGNAREIERVGQVLLRDIEYMKKHFHRSGEKLYDPFRMYRFNEPDIPLSRKVNRLRFKLEKAGADVTYFDKILKPFRLSLGRSKEPAFKDLKKNNNNLSDKFDKRFGVIAYDIEPFKMAYRGFRLFCLLFFQNTGGDANICNLSKKNIRLSHPLDQGVIKSVLGSKFRHAKEQKFAMLAKTIFEFLSHIRLHGDFRGFMNSDGLEDLVISSPNNRFLSSLKRFLDIEKVEEIEEQDDMSSMTYHDIRKLYFEKILRTSKNKREAAKKAGLAESTFKDHLRDVGLMPPSRKGAVSKTGKNSKGTNSK